MFLKGFLCGWIAMAAIFALLGWGMTPRVGVWLGTGDTHQQHGYDSRAC